MTGAPRTADVALLQADYPSWDIDTMWTTASNGPDYRILTARRRSDGRLLADRTRAGLARKIRQEA